MSELEREELKTRVEAMDYEEKMLVARTLPAEIITAVMRENLQKGTRNESRY